MLASMISIRRTTLILSRSWYSAPVATYTTRSNGAAFLNNLDFLAPAPSQPRGFQTAKTNPIYRQQSAQSSSREFLKKASSIEDEIDGADRPQSSNIDAAAAKGPNKYAYTGLKKGGDQDEEGGSKRPVPDRPRRDEEIESTWIQYITPEGNQGEKQLRHVLKTFDRSQYVLVEVDSRARPPKCKLFSKKELYEKAKAAKQAKKTNELSTKELQLNWGTDPHDLAHKLAKSRAHLEKGHRLEIQINGKRGKSTTQEDRNAVMERVKIEFEPVSKYVRQPEWVSATTVTMLLQGNTKKNDKTKPTQQQM